MTAWPRLDDSSFEESKESRRMALAPEIVARTLEELTGAAQAIGAQWALVGGQALIAHGVPRDTLDADALVGGDATGDLAAELCGIGGWTALRYDASTGDYAPAAEPTAHYFDDPVPFDLGCERVMYPLRSSRGLLVELLSAQHPVEQEMVAGATLRRHFGVMIPLAPLGGVLLVKAKADRTKDIAALEQAAEHLPAKTLDDAVAWARRRDPQTAEDLTSILKHVRARRTPTRMETYRTKKPAR
jgi:hypothetical protein